MTIAQKAVGIFGGTFDPIHLGHSQTANAVATWLELEQLFLLPAKLPNLKKTPQTSAKQRVEMVELVCDEETLLSCDSRELKRAGYSYTVDTLKEFKQQYPQHCLYFIIGMDSLLNFTQWHQYQEILTLCHLVVNTRPNYSIEQMNSATQQLLAQHKVDCLSELRQQKKGAIIFSPEMQIDVSSTEIRAKISEKKPLKKNGQPLLANAVINFINKNMLYR